MKFTPAEIDGVWIVDLEPIEDERGFFARTFCADEFTSYGLDPTVAQCNVSLTRTAGTVRGLHYQVEPAAETKLVRCVRGAIFDVAVDVRRGSPTFARWVGTEMRADGFRWIYVPIGFAHGFVVLSDAAEVEYKCSDFYDPGGEAGVPWNDPAVAIQWPVADPLLSARDRAHPSLEPHREDLIAYS